MDKRYQVFVSSTFEDLREERSAVIQALLELDCIPAGMEMFPASDDDQWTLIKQVIDDCDYYVIIVGGRHGSTTAEGISFTEREFDYAVEKGIPTLAFTHKQPDLIPTGKAEASEAARLKLNAFRDKVRNHRVVREWSSPEDLGGQVSRSLIKAIKTHPAEGWVRGHNATNPQLLEQLNELRAEKEKLKALLDQSRTEAPEGTALYASGADNFEISGTYKLGTFSRNTEHSWQMTVTWNDIFSAIGPLMFNEASERKMSAFLEDHYSGPVGDLHNLDDDEIYYRFDLDPRVWQTIVIQLRSLGLIQKSKKSHGVNDIQTYWTLTAYGEESLTKLRAIKKGAPADQKAEPVPDVFS